VLRGRQTDKVSQFGHQTLSTFGVGTALSETQWRAVLRQLVALGHVVAEGEFNTLVLADSARAVLKGEVQLTLREARDAPPRGRGSKSGSGSKAGSKAAAVPADLDEAAQARFTALKTWRAQVAREHNLPAYVVFHDAALADMARIAPSTLGELGQISGVGAKKLQAYGQDILGVLGA
jgi:ATP-dependent DNA helicase RecQ